MKTFREKPTRTESLLSRSEDPDSSSLRQQTEQEKTDTVLKELYKDVEADMVTPSVSEQPQQETENKYQSLITAMHKYLLYKQQQETMRQPVKTNSVPKTVSLQKNVEKSDSDEAVSMIAAALREKTIEYKRTA